MPRKRDPDEMPLLKGDPTYSVIDGRPEMRTEYRIRGKRARVAVTIKMPIPSKHFDGWAIGLAFQFGDKKLFSHELTGCDPLGCLVFAVRIANTELDRLDRQFPDRVFTPFGIPYLPTTLSEEEIKARVWKNNELTPEEAEKLRSYCAEIAAEAREWVKGQARDGD